MAVRLRRPREEHEGGRIEIVPLIDIMFFLLATFILATLGMTQTQALAPVRLPASSKGTASPERSLVVAVDAAGTLLLDGRAMGRNELVTELRRRAEAAPGRPALVQGDARTPFAAMTRALEAVGEAGITEVRFASEPLPQER
ncbi:MAG: ExbD/TolR family protein [Opitutia bacterium]|jgi:biopolymer transport protein ExbD